MLRYTTVSLTVSPQYTGCTATQTILLGSVSALVIVHWVLNHQSLDCLPGQPRVAHVSYQP